MKLILFASLLGLTIQAAELPQCTVDKIVGAIYRLEGGDKTKYPYGIKSVDTKGNKEKARQICVNTVRNNYKRWEAAGSKGKYFEFLAKRYCPIPGDKTGLNKNWLKNLKLISGLDI